MKKSRKKILLSSIAMLLVALVALGSATFAWFTINKQVTADTINVTAATAKGLQITGTNGATVENMADSGWVRDYKFKKTTGPVLNPVSLSYTTTLATTAYWPQDNTANGVATAAGSKNWTSASIPSSPETNDTTTKDAYTSDGNFAVYRVGVKSTDGTISNVKATLSVDGTATKLGDKYVRAVLVNSSNAVVASYGDGAASTNAITGLGTGNTYDADQTAAQAAPIATSADQSISTTATYYTLYVWFEGQDEQCVDANQSANVAFKLSFAF